MRSSSGSERIPAVKELEVVKVLVDDDFVLSNVVDKVADEHKEPEEHGDQRHHVSGPQHRPTQVPVLH